MKPKIAVLIHTDLREKLFTPKDCARLNTLGNVAWTDSATPITDEEAIGLCADAEIAVGSWGTPKPNQAIMDACPKVKLWEHVAGSVKSFFGPHLDGRDLTIASCKSAIADCVGEMTVAEISIGLRKLIQFARASQTPHLQKPSPGKVLFGSTVGIIGASEVGKRVIKLLRLYRCRMLCYDPFLSRSQADELGVELVADLEELCRRSDAVSIHTPALRSTKNLLSAQHFAAMKDDTVFVNTSRGTCIDEAALIAELEKGRLFAFLDVSDPEPAAENSLLRSLPNVVYTPHIAGPATFNMGKQAVDDIEAFIHGKEPMCVVTENQLERVA
jgi:phosphoglycerate dehydrogenase-like enzyme